MKLDYFLYSCFEFEQTCKALPGKAMGPQRWPAVVSFLDGERENFREFGDLQQQLNTCQSWYLEQFPALGTDRSMTMDNISNLTAPTVYFCLDIKMLSLADSQNAADALAASDYNGVWELIDNAIDKFVPNFASHIKTYLRWVFVKKDEQVWDVGSRPPVGRYAPFARRAGSTGRPGGDNRGPRRSGPGNSGGSDRGGRGGNSNRGPERSDRHERNDRNQNGPRDSNRDTSRRDAPPARNNHADQERTALEAVRIAVDQLRNNPSLAEIRLDPSNSFFRRLQHKKAVSEGFHSFSIGEGMQRAVVVTREKQELEDIP